MGKISFKKNIAGYTIIETMIAVSLFVTVVMIGMGALLNANLLHQKSQKMRSIMDNLSFIMEDISRNLRTGYNYHCIDDGNLITATPHSCASGGGISFQSTLGGRWVYYIGTYNGVTNSIFKSIDGASNFVQLNSEEIVINTTTSSFSVTGAEPPPGNNQQPFVVIKLVGTITYKNVVTPFSLQTSVSQRVVDI